MTVNGVMAVALRYFAEFGKPVNITASICGGIYAPWCRTSATAYTKPRHITKVKIHVTVVLRGVGIVLSRPGFNLSKKQWGS